jgi:hypothetical protein
MLKKVMSVESGQILTWTLVILGIGALLIPPLLSFVNTNLGASRTIEEGLKEQYAADAGVEYALYRLANDDDVPFSDEQTPTLVNNMPVMVTVESEGDYYKITSTAKDTVICSYVQYFPGGNLDIYKGALVSSGDIDLAKDCTVDGDIRYGGDFDHGSGFTHLSGDEIPGDIEFPPSDEFAQTYKQEALVGGTHTGDMNMCDGTLGPKYITGDLNVGMNCVVTLEGTIYVDGMIDVQKDGEFRGVGSIVAEGDIYMAKVSDFGTDSHSVIMSVHGNITFKKDATLEALIYAPEGEIKFDKEGTVTGGVIAAKIQADKLNLFAYDASFYDGFRLPGYEDPGYRVTTYHIYP